MGIPQPINAINPPKAALTLEIAEFWAAPKPAPLKI
jgi:hypothetical protein